MQVWCFSSSSIATLKCLDCFLTLYHSASSRPSSTENEYFLNETHHLCLSIPKKIPIGATGARIISPNTTSLRTVKTIGLRNKKGGRRVSSTFCFAKSRHTKIQFAGLPLPQMGWSFLRFQYISRQGSCVSYKIYLFELWLESTVFPRPHLKPQFTKK